MANTNNGDMTANASSMSAPSTSTSTASSTSSATSQAGDNDALSKLSAKVLKAYSQLALEKGIRSYELSAQPISGVGENSYGLILRMCVRAQLNTTEEETITNNNTTEMEMQARKLPPQEMINILKISPKNPAFRAHSRIKELYQREAFMYQQVFTEFQHLHAEIVQDIGQQTENCDNLGEFEFNIVPELMQSCLDEEDEFFIFEDLTLSDYKQNQRTKMPTVDLVAATFRAIAKFHAMSFVLQSKKPNVFHKLIQQMDDNLFIENIEPITIEFGQKYIRKTRVMLEQETKQATASSVKQIEALKKLEDNFKAVCMQCVNGKACAPYAVICHGDFWNNNMLYRYDSANNNQASSAKLIDFQLSRYAAPVLDLVHYFYTCTERDLRKKHFADLLDIYYQTLSSHIEFHQLKVEDIYPRHVFEQQLKEFGIFGFCMAAFSIPFFISNTSELPDLEEVATAIREISSSENSDMEEDDNKNGSITDAAHKRMELLDEYDLLSERTLPIFRRRMLEIVKDLEKYEMLEKLMEI